MDKDLFARLDQLKQEFAGRSGITDGVGVEITLATGRTFEVQTVVETHDSWVQIDGRDMADVDEKTVSFAVPYFQINFVQFAKQRPRRQAGFGR